MSERGSYTTEYIYCEDCYNHVREVIKSELDYVADHAPFRIVSGFVGGLYSGEEIDVMEHLVDEIKKKICCDVRIVVIPEGEDPHIFNIKPIAEATQEIVKDIKDELSD